MYMVRYICGLGIVAAASALQTHTFHALERGR